MEEAILLTPVIGVRAMVDNASWLGDDPIGALVTLQKSRKSGAQSQMHAPVFGTPYTIDTSGMSAALDEIITGLHDIANPRSSVIGISIQFKTPCFGMGAKCQHKHMDVATIVEKQLFYGNPKTPSGMFIQPSPHGTG